jgi:RNA polymerase sigma-70 factor (ECF subfamily)
MDNERFWKLLEPVHRRAAAFCRRLAGSADDGDDLYQDTLLTALRKFGSLRDQDAFRSWLYRIMVNSYRNRCRGWWYRRRVDLEPGYVSEATAEDPRLRLDAERQLHHLLAILAPQDRALVVLHEIEGWSLKELAAVLGKPEGTVRSRLCRARRRLRRRYEHSHDQTKNSPSTTEVAYAMQRPEKSTE